MRPLLVDAFMANNEIELGLARLDYLANQFEVHYIAEARFTHSGNPKPLHFEGIRAELESRANIVLLTIPDWLASQASPDKSRWVFEKASRDWLAAEVVRRHPRATLYLSDLDEIPSLEQVSTWSESQLDQPLTVPMKMAYRRGNWRLGPKLGWTKAKVLPASMYRANLRLSRLPATRGAEGLHLSYLNATTERLLRKLEDFAHEEFDLQLFANHELLSIADKFGLDHLGRFVSRTGGLLHNEGLDELNQTQRQLLYRYPDWFSFAPFSGTLYRRTFLAFILFCVIRSEQIGDAPTAAKLLRLLSKYGF